MPAPEQPRERTERPLVRASVQRTERITPHMVRVVFGGDGLADFVMADPAPTDSYVKLVFAPADAPYDMPYDLEQVKRDHPAEFWPALRTYTVRSWDADAQQLAIDFVVHGDEGIAGPWAAAAAPGDELYVRGPGGAYAPSTDADWHLFVGDDSALPAIAAGLAALPAGSIAVAVLEVGSAADEYPLDTQADLQLTWLHRDEYVSDDAAESAITQAVRELDFGVGQVHAFVHGDAGFVRELRRFLRVDKAVPRELLSISGYWKRGLAEDGWRSAKREWNTPVDAAEAELDAARDERPPRA